MDKTCGNCGYFKLDGGSLGICSRAYFELDDGSDVFYATLKQNSKNSLCGLTYWVPRTDSLEQIALDMLHFMRVCYCSTADCERFADRLRAQGIEAPE
jgi:hypothetical protein